MQYRKINELLTFLLHFAIIKTFFLTCTIFKFSPSFMTMTNRCLGMTRPLMVTMTIILTFEYYGRIVKLNIYDTMLIDIYYFEVTYQSNQFAPPIQDCRYILHCCKYLYYYNQHCSYMKILWKKEIQLRSGILIDRIQSSFTMKMNILKLLPKQFPSASQFQPRLHWQTRPSQLSLLLHSKSLVHGLPEQSCSPSHPISHIHCSVSLLQLPCKLQSISSTHLKAIKNRYYDYHLKIFCYLYFFLCMSF